MYDCVFVPLVLEESDVDLALEATNIRYDGFYGYNKPINDWFCQKTCKCMLQIQFICALKQCFGA